MVIAVKPPSTRMMAPVTKLDACADAPVFVETELIIEPESKALFIWGIAPRLGTKAGKQCKMVMGQASHAFNGQSCKREDGNEGNKPRKHKNQISIYYYRFHIFFSVVKCNFI